MANFSVPKSPKKSVIQMDYFQGCDFTNSPANVDQYKSPNCVNMVRDVPGKVRKSLGWHSTMKYPDRVNGAFYLRSADEQLIHAGDKIYHNNVLLYEGANDARSKAWQFDDKLYIVDGKELLVHWCEKASEEGIYGSHDVDVQGTEYTVEFPLKENDTVYFTSEKDILSVDVEVGSVKTTVELGSKEWSYENTRSYTVNVKFTFHYAEPEETTETISTTLLNNWYYDFVAGGYSWLKVPSVLNGEDYALEIKVEYSDGTSSRKMIKSDGFNPDGYYVDETGLKGTYHIKKYWSTWDILGTQRVSSSSTATYEYVNDWHPTEYYFQCMHATAKFKNFKVIDPDGKETKYDSAAVIRPVLEKNGKHKISFSVTTTCDVYKGREYYGDTKFYNDEFILKNYDMGNLNRTIGRRPVDGFIDDLDNLYVEADGYRRVIKKVADEAYIPTITVAKDPRGGGTSYESFNLIQPAFIELFQSGYIGEDNKMVYPKEFQLSVENLDDTEVLAKILDEDGEWVDKKEGTDFSVDREHGIVTFVTAPGESPLTGEDSVHIQAYKTIEGYADRINKCTISTLFGVNGNPDRLFLSGNADYINYDWYSEYNDPSYFPDTGYSVLGSSSSAIVGYAVISNYLAACKDDKERDSNIILREGDMVEGEPAFPIVAALQGAGAVASWSFNYLETEPIFLTKRGIYAVTAQDITGEKYSQNRSYFLDGKLLEEKNLEDAYGATYNDFYVLALNGKLYMLDGLQPIRTDKSMPYATRQYAGFYRENVPARCLWVHDDKLQFGTEDGRVCEFYTDKYDLNSYNDDGEPIECIWETPDLDGNQFYKNKTFKYMAVRLDSAVSTSINIFTMKRGLWSLAKTDSTKARYFSFPYLNFDKFTFNTDTTQKIIHTKLRVKKVDKVRFRFTNTEVNEPFGLFDIAFEYLESGNYKG